MERQEGRRRTRSQSGRSRVASFRAFLPGLMNKFGCPIEPKQAIRFSVALLRSGFGAYILQRESEPRHLGRDRWFSKAGQK